MASPGSPSDLPAAAVRDQLSRIVATPDFAGYPRSSALLTYVVEEVLAGRQDAIKESIIGVQVFGRPPGYDSRADAVVRIQARRIRERLAHYYQSTGKDDPIVIEIPKGRYVPQFHILRPVEPSPAAPPVAGWRALSVRVLMTGGLAVLITAVSVSLWTRNTMRATTPESRLPAMAVLPFTDLDPGHRFDSFDAGLTEDLERDLSRVKRLRVHARPPAASPASGAQPDFVSLSRKLGVDFLLDGQIVTSDTGKDIRASLIRSSDNSIVWTDHFPPDLPVGAVERKIEEGVTRTLGLNLQTAAPVRPENPKAHDLFFAGRALWATRDPEKTRQAIELYKQALQLDPNYALAYMGIADAYALMTVHSQIDLKTGIERGEEAARKALELDPMLAEAHAALGLIEGAQWKWGVCDSEYQRAIDLNPSYDRAYLRDGVIRFVMGDFAGAERLMRESESLNPYEMSLPLVRAELYYYWRKYNESVDLIREVQKVEPKNTVAFRLLARDFLQQHQPGRSVEAAREAIAVDPQDPTLMTELEPGLHAIGDPEASRVLDRILHPGNAEPSNAFALALMYAHTGDRENTLKFLDQAFLDHVPDLPALRWDPALDLVRNDPRYTAIVKQIFSETGRP